MHGLEKVLLRYPLINSTDSCHECCRSCCGCEADTMIAWVWFRELWEFSGCSPVKFSTVNDDTTDCGSVSTNEFGCGMNNDAAPYSIGRTRYGVAKVLSQPAESCSHVQFLQVLRYRQHQSSDFRGSRCRWLLCSPERLREPHPDRIHQQMWC